MPTGGKRPGAGRPKGSKSKVTVKMRDKLAAREFLRQRVTREIGPLIDAQIANARGLKYLVTRDRASGKFLRVTETMARLKPNEESVEVWEKDPNITAFTDLMNRALDKPKEQQIDINVSADDEMVRRLQGAHRRTQSTPGGDQS